MSTLMHTRIQPKKDANSRLVAVLEVRFTSFVQRGRRGRARETKSVTRTHLIIVLFAAFVSGPLFYLSFFLLFYTATTFPRRSLYSLGGCRCFSCGWAKVFQPRTYLFHWLSGPLLHRWDMVDGDRTAHFQQELKAQLANLIFF